VLICLFSDRLVGEHSESCDRGRLAESRVVGLQFAVGRLIHAVTQTMQSAASPDRRQHYTRS